MEYPIPDVDEVIGEITAEIVGTKGAMGIVVRCNTKSGVYEYYIVEGGNQTLHLDFETFPHN